MFHRVCLAFLLALCLCSMVGAAASEPATTAASPLAAAAPVAPTTLPAWLASESIPTLPGSADFMPPFLFRTCTSNCGAVFQQCKAACNGDALCLQNCSDALGCCRNACVGWGCP